MGKLRNCQRCQGQKDLTINSKYTTKAGELRYSYLCADCRAHYTAKYREKRIANAKKWNREHSERALEATKRWQERNRDYYNLLQRQNYQRNIEKRREYSRRKARERYWAERGQKPPEN